ncbi:hypothetical protein LIA77_08588 [Sarocladium implicatum]|nr:hypothetical protein LIA77_08588 [Sarocladium implicatum]
MQSFLFYEVLFEGQLLKNHASTGTLQACSAGQVSQDPGGLHCQDMSRAPCRRRLPFRYDPELLVKHQPWLQWLAAKILRCGTHCSHELQHALLSQKHDFQPLKMGHLTSLPSLEQGACSQTTLC